MKKLITTPLMIALLAGTALMAQTGKAPANTGTPAVAPSGNAAPAPAKVKKHHRKAKKTAPAASATAPVKK